jgi:hypothetical protein
MGTNHAGAEKATEVELAVREEPTRGLVIAGECCRRTGRNEHGAAEANLGSAIVRFPGADTRIQAHVVRSKSGVSDPSTADPLVLRVVTRDLNQSERKRHPNADALGNLCARHQVHQHLRLNRIVDL